jgi:hypothetical protein
VPPPPPPPGIIKGAAAVNTVPIRMKISPNTTRNVEIIFTQIPPVSKTIYSADAKKIINIINNTNKRCVYAEKISTNPNATNNATKTVKLEKAENITVCCSK